ncbi:MAG: hypothetical protein U9N62_11105 [Thermotogota bacterium]|nr:hypothetical protein [Thermotogota bacterium]
MRRSVIVFFCLIVLLIIVILIFSKTPDKFTVETFNVYQEQKLTKKIIFLDVVTIKAPSDDFIETIQKTNGEYVESDSVLLRMESKEEAYQLAKSKNEYAISLLNSGKAIQEEKLQAVELAENKLENTNVRSPIKGYIIKVPVNERLFVTKGTTLFEILPIDANAYVQISAEEEAILKSADFIKVSLKPSELKWLLEEIQIVEQNNNCYLLLFSDFEGIDRDLLDSLYCEILITYIDNKAAWVPEEYVHNEVVYLEGNIKKDIDILEQKNDLLLVKGLKDQDVLIKKR